MSGEGIVRDKRTRGEPSPRPESSTPPTQSPPAVAVQGLSKHFAGSTSPAVHDLTFTLSAGELLVLLGPSGCGKTTSLRLIAGFEVPDTGHIAVGGQIVWDAASGQDVPPEHRRIGMVFQDYALFPHLTAADNIAFGLNRWPRSQRSGRVQEMTELTGLTHLAQRYPHQLSGGQQQRVALARALAPAPAVILLDEPFSNLDRELRRELREELRQLLAATGAAALFVTHDREEAMALADRIAVVVDGRLVQVDSPTNLYLWPATPAVATLLGPADFLSGLVQPDGVLAEGVLLALTPPLPPGTAVEVMARPHSWTLSPDPDGSAEVADRRFAGSHYQYRVTLPSSRTISVSQPPDVGIEPNTRVQLTLDPRHVVCFAAPAASVPVAPASSHA